MQSATETSIAPAKKASHISNNLPVLEKLASFYPHLFGATFQPLKRGIFQDLMAAHPQDFDKETLKSALSVHTRSTRYLQGVAGGQQRIDLQGQAVEALAPEHVHHAVLEVFRRRQNRSTEDLSAKLKARLLEIFQASGLAADVYAERVRTRDDTTNAMLDEVMATAREQAAKGEALLRAFNASGQSIAAFCDMYGLDAHTTARTLDAVRSPSV
jgi:sRNA-binding protein